MGRRGARIDEPDRWVFNRLAGDYRARPGYPGALVDRLLELAGGAGARVVELGAGTGLLALPLALRGARVVAVEPAAAMLEALREGAGALPVQAVHAPAEETGLPAASAALALLADALQWVDPERAGREVARLLVPGGALAIVEPRLADTPFLAELGSLLAGANPRARPRPPGRLAQVFARAGVPVAGRQEWRHEERLAPERLDAVLRSLSLVGPALGPPALADLLARARRAAERHGGALWVREISLTWGRRA